MGILNLNSDHPRRLTARGQGKALYILASTAASTIERASLIERLRGAEQRYRRLTENAPDMVFHYEFNPQPSFTYVSPIADSITGYSPDDFYEDADLVFKMVYPEDRPLIGKSPEGQCHFGQRGDPALYSPQRTRDLDGAAPYVGARSRMARLRLLRGLRATSPNASWRKKTSGVRWKKT